MIDQLEDGELEKTYTPKELEQINHFFATLARNGFSSNDTTEEFFLEADIEELLNEDDSYEYNYSSNRSTDYLFAPAIFYDQNDVILCGGWLSKKWKQTKKFVKKHKKAILIGAAVVVAVAVVVSAVAVASAAAAGAAGAASSSSGSEKEEKPTTQTEEPSSTFASTDEAPLLKATLEEEISSFKELLAEDVVFQSLECSNNQNDSSLAEKTRELGALLAHQTLDGVSELASIIPQLHDEIKEVRDKFLPQSTFFEPDGHSQASSMEFYEKLIADGHQKIDQIFSTDQAELYTSEVKANAKKNDLIGGILPPPWNLSKGINIAKLKEIINAGQETAVIAEELGFTAHEIAELKHAGTLEKTVASTFESLTNKQAMFESYETFQKAEAFLDPYLGKYLSEVQARELIHQAGIKTFPRPNGIPENFRIKLSKNGAGMKFIHPEKNGTYIRVMPGKPHSPFLRQQKPYINRRIDGKSVDKFGNFVPNNSPEAHIPIEEFIYISK